MKLLEMKCVHDPEQRMDGQEEYFVRLEDEEEVAVYGRTIGGLAVSYQDYEDWDNYMIYALGEAEAKTDDDVYYYIMEDEPEPKVGEIYTDNDGLEWERIENE